MNRDFETIVNNNPDAVNHYSATGAAMSIAANRISFTFHLTGPSFAVDSACSSSLVALHSACHGIRQGDCEMALCGGVSCIIEPRMFVALSKAKMISPDGTSKPFSSRADGYGRGEGCGMVLLKPLKDALRDFNNIWGIISKTAVNQDGRSVTPITKPSMSQQEELLRRIYSESDLANVQYIEAHGTGTPAGDPTEAGSISNAIAKAKPSGSETLRIGSVKSNIGHTESAAGVAGLIKVLLMMKHETIVPSVFYSEDSASVDAAALNLKIPTEPERWESTGSLVRVAGINSFGFGGTNGHAIVKDYRQTSIPRSISRGSKKPFVISAASHKSLMLTIADVYQRLSRDRSVDLNALLYTSACRRSHKHKYRKVFLVSSILDLEQQLASALDKKVDSTKPDIRVVFVFCGNGVTYRGMCKQLLEEEPRFREKVREVEKHFQSLKNISIIQKITNDNDNDDFTKPDVIQPLLFAVQVGIASLLKHWGIKADVVLGHSVGEVAAAHYAGLLSLEEAVKVVHYRSSLQSRVTGGKMLVVSNVAVAKVLEILSAFSGKVCIAAFNSPLSCTLSGNADAIEAIHQRLNAMVTDTKLFLHILEVPAAYHSHMMDSILDDIEKDINCLAVGDMDCELYSTVTGDKCSNGDFTTGRYWGKNIREPVLFEQTLKALTSDTQQARRNPVFVEIGPRRALQMNILETLGEDTVVLTSVQPQKASESMLSLVSSLFEMGLPVNWHQLYSGKETLPTDFPVYQFDNSKKEVQFEARRKENESTAFSRHVLVSKTPGGDNKEYKFNISSETLPYLWQHKNNGVAIVPGSLYVELACASIIASLSQAKIPMTRLHVGLSFNNLLALCTNSHPIKVTLEHGQKEGTFRIASSSATHASGTYRYTSSQLLLEEQTINHGVIRQRCTSVINREEIYSLLSQAGFEYGSVFRQLEEVHFGNQFKEAVTAVRVPGEIVMQLQQFFLHPVVLDYFFQMTAVVATKGQSPRQGFPLGVGCVAISAPLQQEMLIYLRATQETPDFLEVCGCFASKDGAVLVELKDVRISFLSNGANVVETLFFQNKIISTTGELDLSHRKKALIFEDQLGIAKALSPYLHPKSTFIINKEQWLSNELRDLVLCSQKTDVDLEEVLFIWGAQNFSHLSPENVSTSLVGCCELLRQVVLALKESKRPCAVRVITYRSAERTVDYISPGFVLSGMLRACAAEVTELSFQLVDLASLTDEDIQTLVHVINTCRHQEVMICQGRASFTRIARTPINDAAFTGAVPPRDFVLMTADPYRMLNLSAMPTESPTYPVQERSVEVQLTKVCTHSSDYFPVSTSHLDFGKTMYWNKHTSQNHTLLALDFSGVVTATGSRVDKLKVGDHVACCYPVCAASKVVIPEAACYDTETLSFLRETPCLSYFVLAWEVLKRVLPCGKHQRRLAVISSKPASGLLEVLVWTANRAGWRVVCRPQFTSELLNSDHCHAFVFLPPYNQSWCGISKTGESLESHMIFLCNDQMSSALANMFSWEREDIHVHKLNVSQVLQRSNLKAQKRKIFHWLLSLGLNNMDLKRATFQLSGTHKSLTCVNVESYFMTDTLHQVVLDHGGPMSQDCPLSDIPFLTRPESLFKNNCIYIVTGGLSGLGLETVKFIARHGGSCIVTLSRRNISTEMQTEMETLQRRCGVTVTSIQCDVSVSTQVAEAITAIVQSFPSWPIKGVFHSAAVLHDALIENLDRSLFQKVFRPKVNGVLNLHYATLHNKLDYFVCYSSISSFIGNASQCNYSAANSFLDTFCHYRRNLGLAGQSINWGPLNLGLLLNKDHFQRFLETKGMRIMDVLEVHTSLEKCLQINNPQQVVCKFNFSTLCRHVLSQNASLRERLSALLELEPIDNTSAELRLQPLSSLHENLRTMLSKISNVSMDELEGDVTLSSLGIDSMLAMTLQNQLFQDTGVTVPLVTILDPNSTLTTLVAILSNGT
ncbi:Hybrid PKS-NRPS synthetase apdA [Merluccius polli]|uniref:Hybrid PKS-NRPS synthetase apdA n=1 Tax=Merluccius polli TaxID=89951 RepID=A0AA47NRY2_MERPO|nr:Hybrid PKS-NRPS synthetase apdA [Merluccius polli]